jgi:hypothetical protein
VVALVVLVVDLAVEELHAHGDRMLLGERLDLRQAFDRCRNARRVGLAGAVAEHGDHVRYLVLRGERDRALELLEQHRVVRAVVEPRAEEVLAVRGVPHGAHQPRVADHVPFVRLQQVDAGETDTLRRLGELRERELAVGPPSY